MTDYVADLRILAPQAALNLTLIPTHMHEGMAIWLVHGRVPGDFLTAVLSNDLMGAVGRADDINRHRLFNYAAYFYNYAPPGSYGSPEAVRAWAAAGGLRGAQENDDD